MSLADQRLRIERRLRRGAEQLPQRIILDRDPGLPTVWITSTARAGSTWLAELLARPRGSRYLFEPLFPARVDAVARWREVQYFPRDHDDAADIALAQAVVGGELRTPWSDQMNRSIVVRRRVIKEVRSNLLAAWLTTVSPQLRLVLLIRHPFDVAASREALGWPARLEQFLDQERLRSRHLCESADFLAAVSSPFAQQVARWSVENLVALRELRPGEAHVIAYEDLVADPGGELDRLRAFLPGFPVQATASDLARPSRSSRMRKRAPVTPTSSEIDEASSVLSHFGLDCLYPSGCAPQLRERDLLSQFVTPERD